MAFDWREYLLLARFLQGQIGTKYSEESVNRSAVSRAYYAAYCHARNYAHANEDFKPTRSFRDHELLRQHFQRTGRFDIASELEDLRQWRNACDYEDDIAADLVQQVQSALQSAQEIIGKLK